MRIANVVLNDFTRDNRVLKVSNSLSEAGHDVTVVALKSEQTPLVDVSNGLRVERIAIRSATLPRGFVFGLVKFIELMIHIVRRYRRFDIWHCNDIEAFAIGVVAKFFRGRLILVYDCHEYESERNGKSRFERRLVALFEKLFIHKAERVITVSPSIAEAYQQRFGVARVGLIRNLPHRPEGPSERNRFRDRFDIPNDELIFLYQGTFTYNRGLEEALEAFSELQDIHLVCMGYGILEAQVKAAAEAHANIHFMPAVPYHEVLAHTSSADVGLLSVKPTCLSYLYCLPNKLFEYIQAGIPVLSNDLPDCRSVLERYNIGKVMASFNTEGLKDAVVKMAAEDLTSYRSGLERAAEQLNWEREEVHLKSLYSDLNHKGK
jgi:glycosyltransferase involved in cell wall biosynthesis